MRIGFVVLLQMGAFLFTANTKPAASLVPPGRRWLNGVKAAPRTITVATYNILADGMYSCVGDHAESKFNGFYKWSSVAEREWKARWPRIEAEILSVAPDVFFLQEVQHRTWEGTIREAMERRGYSALIGAVGGKVGTRERDLHTAICVKTEDVEVLDSEAFSLSREAKIPHFKRCFKNAHASKRWLRSLGSTSAFAALLRHRATGEVFVCATTHLFWDPRRPDVKASQASLLCLGLQKRMRAWERSHGLARGSLGLILGGDFNAQPRNAINGGGTDGAFQLLRDGVLERSHPDHPSNDRPALLSAPPAKSDAPGLPDLSAFELQLTSAYAASGAFGAGDEPAYTTKTDFTGTLDYIWMTTPGAAGTPPRPEMAAPAPAPAAADQGRAPPRGKGGGKRGGQGGEGEEDVIEPFGVRRGFECTDIYMFPDVGGPHEPEGMPSAVWPSDHFMLAARVRI